MREKFWSLIVDYKIAERYYVYYAINSRRWDDALSAICLLASAASISAWYVWNDLYIIWALILAASQVVGTLKPLFPFQDRLLAARYMRQDIAYTLIEMEGLFEIDGRRLSEDDFRPLLVKYSNKLEEIENRFSVPDLFPPKKNLHEKAQDEAAAHFTHRYWQTEGDDDCNEEPRPDEHAETTSAAGAQS